ncbi:MAG: hypothetical protein ACI9LM_005509 [Alteromonadaceae bacterium]|jgi:hypothetical protein
MSESSSVITKVLETETGKFISKKLFSRLENTLSKSTNQQEADNILQTIAPIKKDMEQKIFDKISDRYLTFRTLLSRDVDVFINDIYYPLRIKSFKDGTAPLTLSKEASFEYPKIACIVGKAGQGKTTFLRKLFINELSSKSGQFPLIITLRRVDWSDNDLTPARLVANEFKELGITVKEDACSYLLQLDRLKIFYDGYDEVENEFRSHALKLITQTYTTFGAKCVVTTRPATEVQLYGGEIHNYALMDLTEIDVIQIIKSHTLISDIDKKQLLNVIVNKKEITKILLTPIIVDIFISTYNSLVAEPSTVIDFYEQLFQTLAATHDRLKVMFARKGISGLNNFELEKVFRSASFQLLNKKNDITFRDSDVVDAFNFATKKLGLEVSDSHIDVINKTSLIKQDGHDYSYLHKSIIEFFAAKHIRSLSDEARQKYYKYIIENYKASHENVLRYLSNIDEDMFYITFVKTIVESIKKTTDIYETENLFKLTPSVFFLGSSFHSLIISKEINSEEISIKPDLELNINDQNIQTNFLKLASILDLTLPTINQTNVIELVELQLAKKVDLKGNKYKDITKSKSSEHTYYRVNVANQIDFDKHEGLLIPKVELVSFYNDLLNLDKDVKKKKILYDEKNALSQFY